MKITLTANSNVRLELFHIKDVVFIEKRPNGFLQLDWFDDYTEQVETRVMDGIKTVEIDE